MKINTVTGPIDPGALGRTLIHEHLFTGYEGWQYDPDVSVDMEKIRHKAISRLKDLKTYGVSTFVDPCPIELGRDVAFMADVSEKSGMRIVCTTGFYFEAHGLPPYWAGRTVDDIAQLYIREIEHGIGDTGIRAGAIKCATGEPVVSEQEKKFLKAASIAQKETGVPIITHTQNGFGGPEQQALFAENGVPAHRCLIGHSCCNPHREYHREIVNGGSYIGFDRIGNVRVVSDEIRGERMMQLIKDGFIAQLLISQDRFVAQLGNSFPLWNLPPDTMKAMVAAEKDGSWPPPYTYLFTDFLPKLKQQGLTDADITQLLEDNPRRFFTGEAIPAPAPR